jgi:hypothetical protein
LVSHRWSTAALASSQTLGVSTLGGAGRLVLTAQLDFLIAPEEVEVVRRLLRSFVVFSVNASHSYSKSFFDEELDITLADTGEREKLRSALGLA